MSDEAKLAIELAKALIQKNNVVPINNPFPATDTITEHKIVYFIEDEAQSEYYYFHELVSYFFENIERYKNW